MILDGIVLVLPISAVLRLHMSTKKKIAVAAVSGLGGLSLIVSITRLLYIARDDLEDFMYQTEKCSWTVVEPALYVLSACLPTMAPFIHQGSRFGKRLGGLRSHAKASLTATTACFREIEGQDLPLPQRPNPTVNSKVSILKTLRPFAGVFEKRPCIRFIEISSGLVSDQVILCTTSLLYRR